MAVDDVIITFSYPAVPVQQLLHGDHLVLWEPGPGTVQEAPGSVPGEGFEVDGQDRPQRPPGSPSGPSLTPVLWGPRSLGGDISYVTALVSSECGTHPGPA